MTKRTGSDTFSIPNEVRPRVASTPRVEFQLLNLDSGKTEQAFADFESTEIGGELAGGCGQGLAEMIERHGSVAGDLTRGIGREQRLRHGLQAALEEVIEADVRAEEREEIVIKSAGRLAGDDEDEAILDGFTQERAKGRERRGLVRDVDDEETADIAIGRILDELDVQGS